MKSGIDVGCYGLWLQHGKELGSDELPPGWTSRCEDGHTVYVGPGGDAQPNRPKSREHQAAVIQAISPDGLAGKHQYYERSTPSMTSFLSVGMILDDINGCSVAGMPFKTVMSTIKGAGRCVFFYRFMLFFYRFMLFSC